MPLPKDVNRHTDGLSLTLVSRVRVFHWFGTNHSETDASSFRHHVGFHKISLLMCVTHTYLLIGRLSVEQSVHSGALADSADTGIGAPICRGWHRSDWHCCQPVCVLLLLLAASGGSGRSQARGGRLHPPAWSQRPQRPLVSGLLPRSCLPCWRRKRVAHQPHMASRPYSPIDKNEMMSRQGCHHVNTNRCSKATRLLMTSAKQEWKPSNASRQPTSSSASQFVQDKVFIPETTCSSSLGSWV